MFTRQVYTGETAMTKSEPRVVTTREAIRTAVLDARGRGKSVGLVPTMGALHEGHLSLVRAAAAECDVAVVTVFVNPSQFAPGEDFERYPRDLDADLRLLAREGVNLVFAPPTEEMYRPEHAVTVEPGPVAEPWEGACRPGHFRGVATIVLKLFHAAPADVAFFGHKDYQQSLVVRRMVEDLDVPIRIRVCPTLREAGGLALSSRNAYLSGEQRSRALGLSHGLRAAREMFAAGERGGPAIVERMFQSLEAASVDRVDYATVADPQTLEAAETADERSVALIAAHVGHTRLIDNHVLGEPFPVEEATPATPVLCDTKKLGLSKSAGTR